MPRKAYQDLPYLPWSTRPEHLHAARAVQGAQDIQVKNTLQAWEADLKRFIFLQSLLIYAIREKTKPKRTACLKKKRLTELLEKRILCRLEWGSPEKEKRGKSVWKGLENAEVLQKGNVRLHLRESGSFCFCCGVELASSGLLSLFFSGLFFVGLFRRKYTLLLFIYLPSTLSDVY